MHKRHKKLPVTRARCQYGKGILVNTYHIAEVSRRIILQSVQSTPETRSERVPQEPHGFQLQLTSLSDENTTGMSFPAFRGLMSDNYYISNDRYLIQPHEQKLSYTVFTRALLGGVFHPTPCGFLHTLSAINLAHIQKALSPRSSQVKSPGQVK